MSLAHNLGDCSASLSRYVGRKYSKEKPSGPGEVNCTSYTGGYVPPVC